MSVSLTWTLRTRDAEYEAGLRGDRIFLSQGLHVTSQRFDVAESMLSKKSKCTARSKPVTRSLRLWLNTKFVPTRETTCVVVRYAM